MVGDRRAGKVCGARCARAAVGRSEWRILRVQFEVASLRVMASVLRTSLVKLRIERRIQLIFNLRCVCSLRIHTLRDGCDSLDGGVVQVLSRDQGRDVGRVDDFLCALGIGALETDDERQV